MSKREKKDGWKIPKLWPGETAFLLGGGPSLLDVNFDLIKDRRIIAINNAYGDPLPGVRGEKAEYKVRDWVDACWFGDERWFWWHRKNLKEFGGILATCHFELYNRHRILACHKGRSMGIDTRPRYVSWNKSSGGSAINFAYHLGVKTIVLLGYDMKRQIIKTDNEKIDRANWHEDHPAPKKDPYERFLLPFKYIKKDVKKLGITIINATVNSALTHFKKMTLEDFLLEECNGK